MHQREGSKLMNRRCKARSSKKEQPDNGTVIEDTEDSKEEKTTKISIENNNKVS
jgi:hypothetical protein